MMFGSLGKYVMAIHATSMAVGSEEVCWVITDDQQHPLSHNSNRHQNKIDMQATVIAIMRSDLCHTLDESQKLKEMFNPDQLVEAMTKVVSNMTMKESPKTSQDTQYHGNFNFIGRTRQPLLGQWDT